MKIKKWMMEFLLIVVMLGLIFILNTNKKNVNAQEVNYLKKYSSLTLQLDENDLVENKAFIVSELHGFGENMKFKYEFLTYLNEVKKINIHLAEISFSSGYILNEYLNTGDEELLDQVFLFYKGSTFYTREEYQFYQKLYQYNKNVDEENKITVLGIDIEHSLDSALYFFNYYNKDDIKDVHYILNHTFDDVLLMHLKNNIIAYESFYDKLNWQERDEAMYRNYRFLQSFYQFDCFHTQLGAKHAFLDLSSDQYQSFAYFLSHDEQSPVKNQVLSIMTFYKDSEYIKVCSVNSAILYKNEKIKRTYRTNNLDVLSEDLVFINLNKEDSPFNERLIWYNQSDNKCEKVTTDYYQYLLFINHSKAATPLNEVVKNSGLDIFLKFIKNLL